MTMKAAAMAAVGRETSWLARKKVAGIINVPQIAGTRRMTKGVGFTKWAISQSS